MSPVASVQGSMDMRPEEAEMVRCLAAQDARFVIVGGYAVRFHGYLRRVEDLDLLYARDDENLQRMHAGDHAWRLVQREREARLSNRRIRPIPPEDRYRIEFLTHIKAVSLEDAFADAAWTVENGARVRVLSRAHLIANKRAVGRQRDFRDVAALRLHSIRTSGINPGM